MVDWSIVLWTDESRFTVFQNDDRVFVKRRKKNAYRHSCIVPIIILGGSDVTVEGAMVYREHFIFNST